MSNIPTPFSLSCPTEELRKSMIVEASAGTGKTYNIQNLVARYIVECDIPIEKILVVTFTEAATAELTERIRLILKNIYYALQKIPVSEKFQNQVTQLIDKFHSLNIKDDVICGKIEEALIHFDEASISTIHGFCKRVISENTFECNSLFDTELRLECPDIVDALVTDFFRKHLYHNPALMEKIKAYPDTQNNLKTAYFTLPDIREVVIKCVKKFDWKYIYHDNQSVVLNGTLPDNFSEKLLQTNDIFIKDEIITLCTLWVQAQLELIKNNDNFMTSDDLLLRVRNVLRHPENATPLLNALHEKYHVMIIDEFQDTDPIQFEIFDAMEDTDHPMVMVGDPKQSIYAFRSGDIYTYFRAKQNLIATYGANCLKTLNHNFRSSPSLIQKVNELFMNHPYPFACERDFNGKDIAIDFPEVGAGNTTENPDFSPPLQVVPLETVGDVLDESIVACADQILALLLRHPNLSPKDFAIIVATWTRADEIAQTLRDRNIPVVNRKRPSIWKSQEMGNLITIFTGILYSNHPRKVRSALLTHLMGKTFTEIEKLNSLDEMEPQHDIENQEMLFSFTDYQEAFKHLHETWKKLGFLEMWTQFLSVFNIRERFATHIRGARVITNLNQITEILSEAEHQHHFAPEQLLRYMCEQSQSPDGDENVNEINLEDESDAVTITSIHNSKGLEYNIVILPDLQTKKLRRIQYDVQLSFHDENHERCTLIKNNQTPDAYATQSAIEALQENLRLAYVAITRAKKACYIYMERKSKGRTKYHSPMDWLLMSGNTTQSCYQMALEFSKNGNGGVLSTLEETLNARGILGKQLTPECGFYTPPPPPELAPLRAFSAPINTAWKITSFSGIKPHHTPSPSTFTTQQKDDEPEESPHDGVVAFTPEALDPVFALPANNIFGNAFHHLMENHDFTQKIEMNEVQKCLTAYGIAWDDNQPNDTILHQIVSALLSIPLAPNEFSLSDISLKQRQTEMEFYLKMNPNFSLKDFAELLKKHVQALGQSPAICDTLHAQHIQGFMNGFIDLWFEHEGKIYILDWKTNSLARKIENFTPDKLKKAVCDDFYFMQYLIYIIAMVKYLKHRTGMTNTCEIYDRYFGGVYYIYARGIQAKSDRGIFFTRPDATYIQELEEVLTCL